MIEIALSGLLLDSPHSGTATYTCNLARWLPRADPDLTVTLYTRRALLQEDGVRTQSVHTPVENWAERGAFGARADKLLWETVFWPRAARRTGADILHMTHFAAPWRSVQPLIVTVHDLVPLLMPDYHRSRQSELYSRFMAGRVRQAQAVITVSEHSRRDIVRTLGIPAERVHVTYEAVDERFTPHIPAHLLSVLREAYGLPERYVLYLGGAERRKNLWTLLQAWSRVEATMEDEDVSLVVVARFPRPDALYPDIRGLARGLGLRRVIFVPAVTEADKPGLYAGALAFVFPSSYEGFGLPPLEAMASGVAVLASNASSLPEVTGEAAISLPPFDEGRWAQALTEVVRSPDLRQDLVARGLERARTFSWERTARETARVYRAVLGQ